MAAHLLEHLHDPAAALQEMVRVTRPGGVIILCLTRRSVLGFYIHLTWRTQLYAVADARTLLRSAGLNQHHMPRLSVFSPLRHFSIACIARKPDAIDAIEEAGTGPRRQR
jgi:SAM-dependent methyltransferase